MASERAGDPAEDGPPPYDAEGWMVITHAMAVRDHAVYDEVQQRLAVILGTLYFQYQERNLSYADDVASGLWLAGLVAAWMVGRTIRLRLPSEYRIMSGNVPEFDIPDGE